MFSRRDFLTTSLVALTPTVPGFLARTARAAKPDPDGRALVVIQLDGGNDGINTAVPFADDGYARHRKLLRLPKDSLVKVNDSVGLNPALADVAKLLEKGWLAVVQGVGYPNPSRSHFESMAIWQTARRLPKERDGLGWLGRSLDGLKAAKPGESAAVYVGPGVLPPALRGRVAVAAELSRPEDLMLPPGGDRKHAASGPEPKDDLAAFVRRTALDAYATADRMAAVARTKDGGAAYPETGLGKQLKVVARLLRASAGARVYYASQAGYDTHALQYGTHAGLLRELGGALKAFLDDLAAAKLADRVCVLCFSEFGRTVKENGSAGTDHGTAGPVLLAGAKVKGGLVGEAPSLTELDPAHGDLKVTVDFRQVYATALEGWLGLPAKAALGAEFKRLPLFRG